MGRVLIIFAILLISGCVKIQDQFEQQDPDSLEIWNCRDRFDSDGGDIFALRADVAQEIGTLIIPGLPNQETNFVIEGLDRRWDWTLSESNSYKFTLVISPDGSARYYHFLGKETAKPRALYSCIKVMTYQ